MVKSLLFDGSLPDFIRPVSETEGVAAQKLFLTITEERPTPLDDIPQYKLWWSRKPMITRLIPSGIHPLDREDGFNHEEKLQEFFDHNIAEQLIIWGHGFEHLGYFSGHYSADVRTWIFGDLIITPSILVAPKARLVLIAHEQMEYTRIIGPPELINELDQVFGGKERLKEIFRKYVDDFGVGFGAAHASWAKNYLLNWIS